MKLHGHHLAWAAIVVNFLLIAVIFRSSLADTVSTWLTSEEYNYGPIVPPIVALMLWRDLRRSEAAAGGGWLGTGLVLLGLALGLVEYLGRIRFPGQLGAFLAIVGVLIAVLGEKRARSVWPALVFLFFAMPLALAIQVKLTSTLQLVSSKGAVVMIEAFGIPVFREGNVIDLGSIKLEVAEACAGLRYLFPLASFAFLCAYLFVAHPISRLFIFLSSVPITIGMNIFRIAVTAFLVDQFGSQAAEGFFHAFEGWFVYCLCVALLFMEMKLICLFDGRGRSLLHRLDFEVPAKPKPGAPSRIRGPVKPAIAAVFLCLTVLGAEVAIGTREDVALPRLAFALFPRQVAEWVGADAPIDRDSLNILKATDYLSVNYARGPVDPVNVWIAYYDSQYSGASVHSPEVCIPGGGWQIQSIEQITLPLQNGVSSRAIPVNRLIIRQGDMRQLVYYWLVEGGRIEADEYQAKINLVMNAIVHNRRDGALVRFVTPIDGDATGDADRRLQDFISKFEPRLSDYLPYER